MIINPSNDRVLIKPITLENKSAGGIVLRGELADDRLHGKVLAMGPGKQNANGNMIPIKQCNIGDIVVYGNVASTVEERLDNGDKCILIVAEAIVAVLTNG